MTMILICCHALSSAIVLKKVLNDSSIGISFSGDGWAFERYVS